MKPESFHVDAPGTSRTKTPKKASHDVTVDDIMAYIARCNQARAIWDSRIPGDLRSHFNAIKAFYKLVEADEDGWDPYPLGIDIPLTPIEEAVWMDIRSLGLHFYKQFPVGRYFVDFGDPLRKIAVECDGKEFHNAEKDAARDDELYEMGWTTIRFTGRECFLPYDAEGSPYQVLKAEYGK